MAALGTPLLVSPSLVLWMLSPDPHPLSSFESYICRSLAVHIFLAIFLLLVCSGELKRLYGDDHQGETLPDDSSPIATITLVSTVFYHFALAITLYAYSLKPDLSSALTALGGGGHLVLGVAGLLILVFRGDGKISKRTGADKRTSGFIFKNTEASKKHK